MGFKCNDCGRECEVRMCKYFHLRYLRCPKCGVKCCARCDGKQQDCIREAETKCQKCWGRDYPMPIVNS